MEKITIPKNEQIEALLEGKIYDLMSKYLNKKVLDFRPYLNVTRSDIKKFLLQNPSFAKKYFEKMSPIVSGGEQRIEKQGDNYIVFSIDRGKIRKSKVFETLEDGVIEHVLVNHGMY